MNVLLVDDEATMRKMVKVTLQKRSFQVFDAANALDALTLSQQHQIDVVVTDIVMKEMDGWALADLLARQRPGLPVVFMSGYPIDFEKERQKYSPCAFLSKPFQPGALMNAIFEVTGLDGETEPGTE